MVAKDLYYTDTPLTTEQMSQLDQLSYIQRVKKNLGPWAALFWDEMLKQAGEFLSESQMAALKQMRERSALQEAENTLSMAARTAVTEAAKQPGASTGVKTEASQ